MTCVLNHVVLLIRVWLLQCIIPPAVMSQKVKWCQVPERECVCSFLTIFSSASVHYHSSYPCMQLNYWNPFSHKCEDRFTMNTQLLLLSLKTIICIDFAVIWLVNLKIKDVVLESWVTLLKRAVCLRFFTGLLYVTACKSVRKMAVYFK